MLVLYRKVGQAATRRFSDDIDPSTPIDDIFEEGDIVVGLSSVGETTAGIGVEALRAFQVTKSELLEDGRPA